MTFYNDPGTNPPRYAGRGRSTSVWLAGLIAVIVLAGVAVWAYRGNTHTTASVPPVLTGQAESKSGSTTVGAPAGTKPSETTGQATTPSGSATTGAKRQ